MDLRLSAEHEALRKTVEEFAQDAVAPVIGDYYARAEKMHGPYDFVVSRAVAPVRTLLDWTRTSVRKGNNSSRANGWIFLNRIY